MQLCWPRYPPPRRSWVQGGRGCFETTKPTKAPRQPAPRQPPPPTAANRYQVSKNGDPVKTALVVPGVMLLNGGIFLSIFYAISKLMAAKVGSRRRPRCWEVTLNNR